MGKIYFIVNPRAGNGRCQIVWNKIEMELQEKHIAYLAFFTEYPGHAKELAQSIAKNSDGADIVLAAVGGDGTLHELINGAVAYQNVRIGFIPGGSGNDFSRGFSIPKNPLNALTILLRQRKSPPRYIDIGKIVNEQQHETYFVNNMGAGFDALVSDAANSSPLKGILNRLSIGRLIYVYILLKTLVSFRRSPLELTVDGKEYRFNSVWFVTVSNQPFYGGGMKIAPDAMPDDGLLNVTVVHSLPRWKLLLVFGTVFYGGHLRFKEVDSFKGRTVTINSASPYMVHADGEIIGKTPIQVQVCPAVLPISARNLHREERDVKEMNPG
ncbi:diacylglycerol/lipid kinase family protein [Bacillus sp. V33-4]|uniref:diacylglycerol/lipid kinase family protein n=1 Tax=Bacillus sp. V33-4 TaxID=2054169 RepID=UPI000C774723|nr:diacylglycerol kinase family protein [Bacillus sp. V33-4]PLR83839.1 diacylglycerol kinase [Bacillus sp. V33-4]